MRRFLLLTVHLIEINHRGGILNCSGRALRHLERPRSPGLKGPTAYVMSSDCNFRTPPPPETHKEISEGQHFHPTLPSEADPGAIVGENNRRRHPDPVGMLKCQPESKMCVCSGCVRCIIVAFLTGWSCRTWAALAALKSPRRTARGCVTDDLGAAGGGEWRGDTTAVQRRIRSGHLHESRAAQRTGCTHHLRRHILASQNQTAHKSGTCALLPR